jgi:hypothetical protein
VAQYIILAFTHLWWLFRRCVTALVPHLVYGFQPEKVTAKEKSPRSIPKELQAVFQQRSDALARKAQNIRHWSPTNWPPTRRWTRSKAVQCTQSGYFVNIKCWPPCSRKTKRPQ